MAEAYLLELMLVDLLPEVLAYSPGRHSSIVLLYEHLPESGDSSRQQEKAGERKSS